MYFNKETVSAWQDKATNWLTERGFHPEQVETGIDAWAVAHMSGITREAYEDRNAVDAHIQTALEKIFPNAVFKDKKRY